MNSLKKAVALSIALPVSILASLVTNLWIGTGRAFKCAWYDVLAEIEAAKRYWRYF